EVIVEVGLEDVLLVAHEQRHDQAHRRHASFARVAAPPTPEAIAAAAAASPLRTGPPFSALADADELRFREELQPLGDPAHDVPAFVENKELVPRLEHALAAARLAPGGVV